MPGPKTTVGNSSTTNTTANVQNKEKKPFNEEGLLTKFLLIIIILLLLSLPILVIKFDIRGLGQKARPLLEDIPYIQKILPAKPDPADPKYMNKKELTKNFLEYKAKYEQLSLEANALRQELEKLTNVKENLEQFSADQRKVKEEELRLQQEKQQLEQEREQFFKDIKDAKKTDFKAYFEKIDKEKAQQLYQEILQEEKADKKIKEYVSYYENMDPENAAKIFDAMSTSKSDLVVNILKYMNKEQAAAILSAMKPDIAAKISDGLSKEYLENGQR